MKSQLETYDKLMADADARTKQEETKRQKIQKRIAEWEWIKTRFERMEFTVNQDPTTCPTIGIVAAIHLIALTAVLLSAPTRPTELTALPFLAVCALSLGSVALGLRAYDNMYRKTLFMLSATVYLALIITSTVAQLFWGSSAAITVIVGMAVYSGHSLCVIALVWGGRRLDRTLRLKPRPLATYKFLSWGSLGKDDARPDSNRKKEIDHESAKMWVMIEHHTHPKRKTTVNVCAATIAQACGQGVIMGTGDLEACATAVEGAMRRLSTVNSDRTEIFERGIQCQRTLHLVKAIIKHSQQCAIRLEPELGF